MAVVMAQHVSGMMGMQQGPMPMLQPQQLMPQAQQLAPQIQLPPQAQLPPASVRLDAYRKVFAIFMAGSYDLAKEDALASLRLGLVISDREHESVKAAAMAEAQHHLMLHPLPSQAGNAGGTSQDLSAAHSSQAAGSRAAAAAAAPKRATPASGSRAAAAPRKRSRVSDGAAGPGSGTPATGGTAAGGRGNSRAGTRAQAAGPTLPAPRAAPGVLLDPLVGHVVMRHWPSDGGWFQGVISDFQPDTGNHCIIYDMGTKTESYEWYRIRGASQQDCIVKEEKANFSATSLPAAVGGAAASGGTKSRRAPAAGTAAGAPARAAAAGSKQAAAPAGKAGASRQGAGAPKTSTGASKAPAGSAKPAAARASSVKPAGKPTPPPAAVVPQQAVPQQAPAAAQQQQPIRNGKTHSHHNGLTSHAAAVKQALAAGGRPSYLNGHTMLPRRTRNWSSDEESSDDDDDE